jgi:hypothetical protein
MLLKEHEASLAIMQVIPKGKFGLQFPVFNFAEVVKRLHETSNLE